MRWFKKAPRVPTGDAKTMEQMFDELHPYGEIFLAKHSDGSYSSSFEVKEDALGTIISTGSDLRIRSESQPSAFLALAVCYNRSMSYLKTIGESVD